MVAAVPTVAYSVAPWEVGKQVNLTGLVLTLMPLLVVRAVLVPT